jgi:hypothetical protein
LSGACIDDNPLSAFFIFVSLFLLPSIFSQAVVVLFERARDRKNKAQHFPNNGEKDRRGERFLSMRPSSVIAFVDDEDYSLFFLPPRV